MTSVGTQRLKKTFLDLSFFNSIHDYIVREFRFFRSISNTLNDINVAQKLLGWVIEYRLYLALALPSLIIIILQTPSFTGH